MALQAEQDLYFQYQPDQAAQDKLDCIAAELQAQLGGEQITGQEQRLTLLHFGRVGGMYRHINIGAEEALDEADYYDKLETFAHNATQALPPELTVSIGGYSLYRKAGQTGRLLASCEPTPDILAAQRTVGIKLIEFLRNCGVVQVEAFVKGSNNLRSIMWFQAGIPLLRGVEKTANHSPAQDTLHLQRLEPWYDLAHDRQPTDTQNTPQQV